MGAARPVPEAQSMVRSLRQARAGGTVAQGGDGACGADTLSWTLALARQRLELRAGAPPHLGEPDNPNSDRKPGGSPRAPTAGTVMMASLVTRAPGALGAEVHPLWLLCPSVYTWVGRSDEGESNPGPTPSGV